MPAPTPSTTEEQVMNQPITALTRGRLNPDMSIKSPGYKPSKTYRQIRDIAVGTQDFLPALIKALSDAQAREAGPLAESQLDIYRTLGPEFTKIASELAAQGQSAQAATDARLLGTTGRDVTSKTLELQKLADPEFFALREALGGGATKLLGGIDPNQLTEAEIANLERTQNRTNIAKGVANIPSNLAAIKSSMTFGDRLSQKQNSFAQTLNAIGNLAPNLKSGAFNYAASTGQAGAGQGQSELGGSFATTQNQSAALASNLLGQTGGINTNERNIQANKIAGWERVLGSSPDY